MRIATSRLATPRLACRGLGVPLATSCLACSLAFLLAFPASLGAENWPQWRGPRLDGTSTESDLPLTWSPTENITWKQPLPARSGATPIVWNDHVFLNVSHDPEQDDGLELWAVDRNTGQVRWKRPLGGGNALKMKHHMSSPSPVTDGTHVWVMTGTGVLAAFTFDGTRLWSRNLQEDYGDFGHKWGYAASPLLLGDALYVPVLHGFYTDAPSYLLKVDARSGETVWRQERPTDAVYESPDAYTTVMPARLDGKTRILVAGGDVFTAHSPRTGEELWRAGGLNPDDSRTQRLVASPLVVDGRFFAFGKRGPVLAFRPGGELAWSWAKGTDVPTPVSDGEHLYIVNDRGIVHCLEVASGRVVYGPERLKPGTYSASPVLADGRIYAVNEQGVTTVFRTGAEFHILATNELEGYTLASPAISDGQIFVRTAKYLYAIGSRRR